MTAEQQEQNKLLVRRLVEEAVNQSNLDVLAEVADGEFAQSARQWIGPFRVSFPDFRMEIVDLIAEDEKVAAHFRCSGTQQRTSRVRRGPLKLRLYRGTLLLDLPGPSEAIVPHRPHPAVPVSA